MSVPEPPDSTITDAPDADEPDDELEPWGLLLSWPRLGILLLAVAFLGGAIVYFVDSRVDQPGAVDIGFYEDMTTHHDQAIQMALLELSNGENQTVQSFAREILIFQNRELGIMATRLEEWGQSMAERPDTAMGWMNMPVPVDDMPGLATPAQLDALEDARGADADALFLDLLAEHHRGGVHMAAYAVEHADDAQVRALADRMARNQVIEINELAQTATRLGFAIEIPPYDASNDPVPGN